ncbi:DUF5123 domain-containing protein [Prevotella sp. CAG:592]|uniref:DUF5123 domain-containing protein n=1 Tax=Prevotella TaxID=838 RepID=UPI0003363A04|nr:DUF5123 domain-containing protein [Prevotella sp. CAG:592]MDD7743947.1 DUF5123 domain-containing protein [Prevotella pectinovora]MEE0520320.1 DUF5123 domain-containing protein [Bacteroidaceae bacterium]CDD06126.1 putative uncharacterized protein [Prevotella sp. CAG:592]
MKLNKSIISKALFGAMMLLGGASFTACTETNDWDVDPAYDRLFHSSKVSVSPGEDQAEVTFKKMPDAEFYVIEISTDTLFDEVETTEHSIYFGDKEDARITTSPYTMTGLEGSTKYYFRIKSCATNGKGSTWKYLDDTESNYSFTTKSEQIILDVVPGSKTVKVSFKAGKQITEAQIVKDDEVLVSQPVTADEVAAGELTISGLNAKTSYTVQLLNGENVRGKMKFTTTEPFPDGYEVINVAAGDDVKDLLANATSDKVVVVFPQGMEYTALNEEAQTSTIKVPENIKSVYFWGAAGESKATVKFKGVSFDSSSMDVVRFYNLNLQYGANSDGYVLNQSGTFTLNSLEMEKCDVKDIRGIFRFQSIVNSTVNAIKINDCVLTNIGTYGIVNTKDQKSLTLGTVSITNSTLNTINSVLTNTSQANFSITLDHCTIWNCVPATKPYFDLQKQTGVTVACTNSLIGAYYDFKDAAQTVKGSSLKDIDATGTVYTSDFNWNSGYEIGSQISETSAQLWANPAKTGADFTVQNSSYKNLGDPRWIPAE